MTRSLPWLQKKRTGLPERSSKSQTVSNARKHARLFPASSDIEDPSAASEPAKKARRRDADEPTSSPDLETPPIIFMQDGLDHDDRYRMVEDEFLETAKLFTQHLHAAEYRRLRETARSQNASSISTILRPVVARMSDSTKRKVEGVARARKQHQTIRDLHSKTVDYGDAQDSEEELGAWIGTTLHGLMGSPRKSGVSLMSIGSIGASSDTRASAGHHKARPRPLHEKPLSSLDTGSAIIQETRRRSTSLSLQGTSEDDDGLEATPQNNLKAGSKNPKPSAEKHDPRQISSKVKPKDDNRSVGADMPVLELGMKQHDDCNASTARLESELRLAKRREQVQRRRIQSIKEELSGKKSLDVIPTFL